MDEKVKALAAEWMRKADHDRGMAKLALDARSPFTDGVCFHAQQAAEKDLKACLVSMGMQFEKSHDLSYLLDLIDERHPVNSDLYDAADALDRYAVEVRYPDALSDPTPGEAQEAFDMSMRFRELAQLLVAAGPQPPQPD